MEPYLLLLLLAGLVATDTTSGPQMLFSEPLVSCSIGGIIIGNPALGLEIGMLFQLLWIGYMPLGAVRFTDSNVGSLVTLASLFMAADMFGIGGSALRAAEIPALMLGIVTGIAGSNFRGKVRRFNNRVGERLQNAVESGEIPHVAPWHIAGISASFLRGVMMMFVFVPAGAVICMFTGMLPDRIITGLAWSVPLTWGIASASAVYFSLLKGNIRALLGGLAAGVAWVIITTGGWA